MADGRDQSPGFSFRQAFPWTELFRCFQVALDPRKLLVAAAGIIAMSLGWWILSSVFWYKEPDRGSQEYTEVKSLVDKGYSPEDARAQLERQYYDDRAQWAILDDLAGDRGRLRTMPWSEYRGGNPYLFVTQLLSSPASTWGDLFQTSFSGIAPVLVEPLAKLLVLVANLIAPTTSFLTRIYLLLAILWFFAVWGFAGGVITRLAAVQLTGKDRITLRQAVQFVADRYVNYLLSPVVPLLIIAAVIAGLFVFGLLAMIPLLGDIVLLGVGLPVILVAGAVMAVFLIGLVGYPLMYTTLSVEGDSSDTFDALSRSINYVYQAPWQYIWYSLVAVVYGAVVTFFVLFFASLTVYMGKWAVSIPAGLIYPDRKPDYMFIYAPESFGWKELLLKGSPAEVRERVEHKETGRKYVKYDPVNPTTADQYRKSFSFYNTAGAGIVAFWLALFFLMMLGFTYSFFWSAATMIYLLMRKKVDEAELDEVFLEEEEPEAPLPPPKVADAPAPAATSLPVLSTTSPPVPPPPATLPFSPPPATTAPVPPTVLDTAPKTTSDIATPDDKPKPTV